MASIRKRGDAWEAQVRRRGYKPVTKNFKRKADAEQWARQKEVELASQPAYSASENNHLSLGQILTRYKDEISPKKRSRETEIIRLKKLLRFAMCDVAITKLTSKHLAAFRDQRLRDVCGSTVNRELTVIRHAIQVARREWDVHLPENPMDMVTRPKSNKGRDRRLKPGEEEKLLEAFDDTRNPWMLPVVILAIETGMRRGEILSLSWNQIDLATRIISLFETKNGEDRDVPLSTRARDLLVELPKDSSGVVFPVTPNAFRLSFNRARVRAGMADLHFHDLRHEAISRLFEKGFNVMEAATVSGHKDLRMLKRYTHIRVSSLLEKMG